MAHVLRYGATSQRSILRSNPRHRLAHDYAMQIFDSCAIYSMIPKNGCTTMRLSIALANGVIASPADWEWIHHNNNSFRPSLKDLALAPYRFTVLRCPYGRLVSCFLDKIVKGDADAKQFMRAAGKKGRLDRLTFRQFVSTLAKPAVRGANIHWRPQIDFLVYADYDQYFCFEDFGLVAPALKERIGLTLTDARPLARHDSSHFLTRDTTRSFAGATLADIRRLMKSGHYPAPDRFYDDDLRKIVRTAYAADFALYERLFPGKGLFAGQALVTAAV